MAWFFRAVEQSDGSWLCRRGLDVFDTHPSLELAIEHLGELAADAQPAQLYVHRVDGQVEGRGALPAGATPSEPV